MFEPALDQKGLLYLYGPATPHDLLRVERYASQLQTSHFYRPWVFGRDSVRNAWRGGSVAVLTDVDRYSCHTLDRWSHRRARAAVCRLAGVGHMIIHRSSTPEDWCYVEKDRLDRWRWKRDAAKKSKNFKDTRQKISVPLAMSTNLPRKKFQTFQKPRKK